MTMTTKKYSPPSYAPLSWMLLWMVTIAIFTTVRVGHVQAFQIRVSAFSSTSMKVVSSTSEATIVVKQNQFWKTTRIFSQQETNNEDILLSDDGIVETTTTGATTSTMSPSTTTTTRVGSKDYYDGFLSSNIQNQPIERVTGDAVLGPTLKFVGGISILLLVLLIGFFVSNGIL